MDYWWLMPLLLTPFSISGFVLLLHADYQEYLRSTEWLLQFIGPVTVAFAIPIYERRALIRQHWPVLLLGVFAGSFTAILSSWSLSRVVGLDESIRLSMLPRSISSPFAVKVSLDVGGLPELTAIFVIITGILGAIMGELILKFFSFRSPLARGALFGVGAHAAGTAQAHKIGQTEGAVASLAMILVGLLNSLFLPFVSHLLRSLNL